MGLGLRLRRGRKHAPPARQRTWHRGTLPARRWRSLQPVRPARRQPQDDVDPAPHRARACRRRGQGGAHIGVLKVLEQLNVPIDCIAGTSMGALVGGGYASGIPAAELEEFIVGIDWQKVVGSQGRRDLEPIEQKRAGTTYSNIFEFGITPDGLKPAGGLINTSSIEDLLRLYVASARFEMYFDKLPIPFRAVATDMVSGEYDRAEGRRPGHGHARVHVDSRRLCSGTPGGHDPVRRRPVRTSRSMSRGISARISSSS